MSLPAFIPLADARKYPSAKVSSFAKKAADVQRLGVSISPTVCLPPETLEKIHHRHQQTREEILKLYHGFFKNEYVCVYFFHDDTSNPDKLENIQGDANLIHTLEELSTKHHLHPVLIQYSPQPDLSGVAFSLDSSTLNKKKIEIVSAQGVYDQQLSENVSKMLVDARSMQLVSKTSSKQRMKLVRANDQLEQVKINQQKNLTNQAATSLARQVMLIKQQQLSHQQVSWFCHNESLYIQSFSEHDQVFFGNDYQTLCLGEKLVSGYVEGHAVFTLSSLDSISQPILVVEELSNKHLEAVKKANGIVIEKGIRDSLALQTVTRFHIPTIIHAKFATHKIKSGQKIMLDATGGKLVQSSSNKRDTSNAHVNPSVYCLTGLADQAIQHSSDVSLGILFNSNTTFAALGTHPLSLSEKETKLVRAQLVESQKKLAKIGSQVLYMLFSLDSANRRLLRYATSYESEETNPSFGKRGSAYLLEHRKILKIELSAVSDESTVVLPYIFQVHDALLLAAIIKKKKPKLKTEAHICSLSALKQVGKSLQFTKVIIDLDYLLATWNGVDPQDQTSTVDSTGDDDFWQLLTNAIQKMQQEVFFLSRSISPKLIDKISLFPEAKIITTSKYLRAVKST